MTTPEPTPITDANAVPHILATAVHDIAKQQLPGHDQESVLQRLLGATVAVRAALDYNKARTAGKSERDAVRDAALNLVKRYRARHRI